jgi:rhamnopyranosyl-N-acetylglucosaminyl-diphospho-decaprenol beta-1,3/1,4-galactofuranosyltransferase
LNFKRFDRPVLQDLFMPDRVFAVVVTFNRKDMLRECLAALRSQHFQLAGIVVVNNASSDGTREMLESEYADQVTRIHMRHNVGGAGGFYQGMKWAHEQGADWLWLMDDDGIPDDDALCCLMAPEHTALYEVMNALVVCRDDPGTLCFGLGINGEATKSVDAVRRATAPATALAGQINPFNGTLIKRTVVEKLGYTKREMFIWGDERDYTWRLDVAGVKMATILPAIQRHPAARGKTIRLGIFGTVDTQTNERIGIAARNMGYIYRQYQSVKLQLLKPVVNVAFQLSRGNVAGAVKFLRYYLDGFFDRYSLPPSKSQLIADGEQFEVMAVRERVFS